MKTTFVTILKVTLALVTLLGAPSQVAGRARHAVLGGLAQALMR